MSKLFLKALIAALVAGAVQVYADSGPPADSEVPSLKVAAVAGVVSGEERDFAADRKDLSTIYVFVQADKFDRPIARFIRVLDDKLAKERGDVQLIAVWLTDDVEKSKEYLPKAQQSLQLSQTVWSVYAGEKSGPAGWNVDIASHVTAVVAHRGKVVKSFEYKSVNDTIVPEVLKALPPK